MDKVYLLITFFFLFLNYFTACFMDCLTCFKANVSFRRQFTLKHLVPKKSWYSSYQTRKDVKAVSIIESLTRFQYGTSHHLLGHKLNL